MLPEASTRRAGATTHLLPPRPLGVREVDLLEDHVDQGVEQLVLARDVVVDRHRLRAQSLGKRANGETGQAAPIRDGQGGGQHSLLAQPGSWLRGGTWADAHGSSEPPSGRFVHRTILSYIV